MRSFTSPRRKTRSRNFRRRLQSELLETRRVLATFTVTSAADAGAGSLREALQWADTTPGADIVEFSSALDGDTINLTSGGLTIHGDVEVDASSLDSLTIDASALDSTPNTPDGQGARVIDVVGGDTVFRGLTIQGGDAAESGGGIRTSSTILVDNVTFKNNASLVDGSALSVRAPSGTHNVSVQLSNSTFLNNGNLTGNANTSNFGGAVFVNFHHATNGNTLTVTNSQFKDNGTQTQTGPKMSGGGLYFYGKGDVELNNTVFDGNGTLEGSGGGAMISVTQGTLTVQDSTFLGNDVRRQANSANVLTGGGLYAYIYDGTANISDSTMTGNTVEGNAGGLRLYSHDSTVTLEGNEFSYNTASSTLGNAYGGGVFLSSVSGSDVTLRNSTITGNQAGDGGGGAQLYLPADTSTLLVELTTIAKNTAATTTGSNASGGGAGILAPPNNLVQFRNSILADNLASSGADDISGNVKANFTLVEKLGVAVISGTNNIYNTDPMLGPLSTNGGTTRTHGIPPQSPALDAGDPSTPQGIDQRGMARVADGDGNNSAIVDLGAYEYHPTANAAPIADVSLSQSAGKAGMQVALNATRSSDPEGNALSYQWSVIDQPSGSSPQIASPTSATTTLVANEAGAYRVQLVVSDGVLTSAPRRFVVTIMDSAAPVANVSLSENLGSTNSPIAIDASRSADPDGDSLTYWWSIVQQPAGSSVNVDSPTSAATTWTTDTAGVYRVQLIVNDGTQDSAPVRFQTTVTSGTVPTANVSLSENSGVSQSPIVLDGTRSSDPSSATLTYQWSIVQQPTGSSPSIANATSARTTWSTDTPGSYRVRLVVANGSNSSAPVHFLSNVTAATIPTANVSLSQNSASVGNAMTLNGTRSYDANSLPLTFAWSVISQPDGSSYSIGDSTASVTTFQADTAGDYRIRLVVFNGTSYSNPVTFRSTISANRSALQAGDVADPLDLTSSDSSHDEAFASW